MIKLLEAAQAVTTESAAERMEILKSKLLLLRYLNYYKKSKINIFINYKVTNLTIKIRNSTRLN